MGRLCAIRPACSNCHRDVHTSTVPNTIERAHLPVMERLFVCDTHSPGPSTPKCFASAPLRVIDHIETFEICNLSHNLAAEDGLLARYPD
jgi:hypothetical protein